MLVERRSSTLAQGAENSAHNHDVLATHERCRLCGNAIRTVLDLGFQHLQGAFVKPGSPAPPSGVFPLDFARCVGGCGLAQLRHTVAPDVLYSSYWYRSRINSTMRDHLARIAATAVDVLGRRPDRVLDIGCNDGTLLLAVDADERWGIEPSNAALDVPDGPRIIRDFFPSADPALRPGSFDIVTTVAMFYDVDDPVTFARAVAGLLAPEGIWVVEVAYLPAMMANAGYDAICHEHLTYYTLTSLERVLEAAGLTVVGVELNSSNGGSMCCFVARADAPVPRRPRFPLRPEQLRAVEQRLGDEAYDDFATRVHDHRRELRTLVERIHGSGRTIHAYGASTKGNTLLQFCGLDRRAIPYAAERNPDKVGARTLGTDIPIISEAESRRMRPDYFLVLPWHFRTEILDREAETIRRGIRFIFPLPKLEVVEWTG